MSKLYSELAIVYHEMYQSIFDYKKEFEFYDKILKRNNCKSVLEIGCGSGILASHFEATDYQYTGMDLSKNMLKIAKEVAPKAEFILGDMRKMDLEQRYDSVIIPGRSIAYLITNADVQEALKSIHRTLKKEGIFVFDCFNAEKIISLKKKRFVHEAEYKGTKYKRVSVKTPHLKNGWTENWDATYYIREKDKKAKIVQDKSILRSFTKDEVRLFLTLFGFRIQKLIERDAIFIVIAKRTDYGSV